MACNGRVDTEDTHQLSHLQALKQALTNWRVWLFVIGYMAVVGSSTLSYFYPTLVAGLGYSTTTAQYMTIPICKLHLLVSHEHVKSTC